jgi:hypothetical protein
LYTHAGRTYPGGGEAYWVGEKPTSGRAHVAIGHFDFHANSFEGRFLSEMGRTGFFVNFELYEPVDSRQPLDSIDEPDLEAPMVEAVIVTVEQQDAHRRKNVSIAFFQNMKHQMLLRT